MTGPVGAVGAVGGTGGARTGNVVGMDTVDTAGAFVGPALRIAGAPTGPLAGLTFAAKDLIDVAGVTTGAGNPEWARTHPPAAAHAPVVDALLAAGATLVGRTVTDELAYSLAGTNVHHGTPRNPRCPDRVPGGSSSGSASAVAGGAVDIGLGTDTGGSIRVPAAYCGIVGFRPTHGVVDMTGVVGLSPSFDTLGWLTRAVGAAARVAEVLLPRRPGPPGRHAEPAPPRLVVADDALAECVGGAGAAIEAALQALPVGAERTTLGPPGTLERWADAYRLLSGAEAWRLHGDWISTHDPRFGPGVAARFAAARRAARAPDADLAAATHVRGEVRATVTALTSGSEGGGGGVVLVLPSAASVAPRRDEPASRKEPVRRANQRLTCIVSMAGAPAVSLPLAEVDGVPVGVCLVGAPGRDLDLLHAAGWLTRAPADRRAGDARASEAGPGHPDPEP